MRLLYLCERCEKFIEELDVDVVDETQLGFDMLTGEEKEELVHLNWERGVGTVKTICDDCYLILTGAGIKPYQYWLH